MQVLWYEVGAETVDHLLENTAGLDESKQCFDSNLIQTGTAIQFSIQCHL